MVSIFRAAEEGLVGKGRSWVMFRDQVQRVKAMALFDKTHPRFSILLLGGALTGRSVCFAIFQSPRGMLLEVC